jgi:hypothetical protein
MTSLPKMTKWSRSVDRGFGKGRGVVVWTFRGSVELAGDGSVPIVCRRFGRSGGDVPWPVVRNRDG